MKRERHLVLADTALAVILILLLSGCGILEIRIEQPDTPHAVTSPVAEVLLTEPASGRPLEITPTPTPLDYDPWLPEPAFTPVPVGEYPAPAGLRVAFVRDGQIWLWAAEAGEAVPISSLGDDYRELYFSDDGEMLAFRRGDDLLVVHSDGTGQRVLVSAEEFAAMAPADQETALHRFEWVPGTHQLAFSTRQRMPFGRVLNHDLHRMDAESLERTTLLSPGEGGEFHYSPDGRQVVLVTPGKISLIDADGGNRRDGVLLHTPVVTHSEDEYYAQPVWAPDASALRVAIPPANPLAQPVQQTTIWHIPVEGKPASLVTGLDVAPLLGPDVITFSPDLSFVAYAQLRGEQSASEEEMEVWLEVRRLANQDVQAYPQVSGQYGWAPASRRFAFSAGRELTQLKVGQWSGPTLPGGVEPGTPVSDLRWVDADHYLFLARQGAQQSAERNRWELRLADFHGSSTILASSDDLPRYDLVVAGQPGPTAVPTSRATPRATRDQRLIPTPTPVAPLPGLVYRRGDGLWTDTGWERVQLSDRAEARLTDDGNRALYLTVDGEDVDLWLADWLLGSRRNLTRTPDRVEGDPRWWPARPELVLFSSQPRGEPAGIGASGFLAAVGLDGSDYRVLDDQHPIGGPPAPSPDGQTIAYGRGPTAWLYRWDTGPEVFDPADYDLTGTGEIEIGNPSWSPDGNRLAWILSGDLDGDGEFRRGIAIFDLERRTVQELHSYPAAGGDGWPPAASWSRDGAWLVYEARTGDPAESGVWAARTEGPEGGVIYLGSSHPGGWSPAWSPDGQWLAFSGTTGGEEGHWLAQVGSWRLLRLDLPPTAQIVAWIDR